MRIPVFGCGYLGAVHGACMTRLGRDVVGLDLVPEHVASLNRGEAPFFEPGLPELLAEGLATGRAHLYHRRRCEPADDRSRQVGSQDRVSG